MRKVSFLKEPGYVYDLFDLFRVWFKKRENMTQSMAGQDVEELRDYAGLMMDCMPIADELLVFFYEKDNKKTFMTEYYFEPYIGEFLSEKYDLSVVLKLLADYKQVVCNVYKFFFEEERKTRTDNFEESLVDISNLIKKSSYSGEVKSMLYAFFIDPNSFVQKLTHELLTKEDIMAQKYKLAHLDLLNLQNGFDYEELATGLTEIDNQEIDLACIDNMYISFCLYNKNLLCSCGVDKVKCLLLGADYKNYIRCLVESNSRVKLDMFGAAISEKNRVDILNYILQVGETNIKDTEQKLKFTSANAYYHLKMLLKIGMLKSRNKGGTVLYSVNRDYFDSLCDVLKKYSNRK